MPVVTCALVARSIYASSTLLAHALDFSMAIHTLYTFADRLQNPLPILPFPPIALCAITAKTQAFFQVEPAQVCDK